MPASPFIGTDSDSAEGGQRSNPTVLYDKQLDKSDFEGQELQEGGIGGDRVCRVCQYCVLGFAESVVLFKK